MNAGLESRDTEGYDDRMVAALRRRMTSADLVKLPSDEVFGTRRR